MPDQPALRFVAYHEAGHAVAQRRLGFSCVGCTIKPRGDVLGVAHHIDDDFSYASQGEDGVYEIPEAKTRDMLVVKFAGYCAQIAAGDSEESARASAGADFVEAEEGRQALSLNEDDCIAAAFAFVRDPSNWRAIETVAEELLEREEIPGDEIEILFDVIDGESTREDLERYRRMFKGQANG